MGKIFYFLSLFIVVKKEKARQILVVAEGGIKAVLGRLKRIVSLVGL